MKLTYAQKCQLVETAQKAHSGIALFRRLIMEAGTDEQKTAWTRAEWSLAECISTFTCQSKNTCKSTSQDTCVCPED